MSESFGERLGHAGAALIQGVLFVPLLVLTGAALCSGLLLWPGIPAAVKWGAIISFVMAVLLLPHAVAAPVGVGRFLRWFFYSVFLLQVVFVVTAAVVVATFRTGADIIIVYVAGISTAGVCSVVLGILFPDPFVGEETVIGGAQSLSSFEEVASRANIPGRVLHGPGPDQGEANWKGGWRLFKRQHKRARRKFYD